VIIASKLGFEVSAATTTGGAKAKDFVLTVFQIR
jgi:hypothetical protein